MIVCASARRSRPHYLLLCAALALGGAAPRVTAASFVYLATATEQTLWVTATDESAGRTSIYRRLPNRDLQSVTTVNGRPALLAAGDALLHVFFDDGSLCTISAVDGKLNPVLEFRDHSVPTAALLAGSQLYALVSSATAGELGPASGPASTPATGITADPNGLWLVCYEHGGWHAVRPTPATLPPPGGPPGLKPRLALLDGGLFAAWCTERGELHLVPLDEQADRSDLPRVVTLAAAPAGFWTLTVNQRPTLAVVTAVPEGKPALKLYCALPVVSGARTWTAQEQATPALGDGWEQVVAAFAFDQHVGLLGSTRQHEAALAFVRPGGPSLLTDTTLRELLAPTGVTASQGRQLQFLMLVILIVVMAAVFGLRRESLGAPSKLPRGVLIAFPIQRLLAMCVDLLPFTLAWSAVLGLNWADAVRTLLGWGWHGVLGDAGWPPSTITLWWSASAAAYVVYAAIMETLTGRTVGKVLTRVRVVQESGAPAGLLRCVVRNVLRLIELIPPLWVLAFLVVLSPRRQRLGDLFARTVVVRIDWSLLEGAGKATRPGPATDEPPQEPDA
jgi:uncharacterized RDD family membrane protein YckC